MSKEIEPYCFADAKNQIRFMEKLNFKINHKEATVMETLLVMKIGKTDRNFENIFEASSEIVVSPCSTQACLVAPVTPGQTMLR